MTALDLLAAKGAETFSMRALAERLQINPMTIYHHFESRDGLIGAMSERVYCGVSAPTSDTPRNRIEALLRSYHTKVLHHPGLTLLIFSRPGTFPGQAQRITNDIAALLAEAGLSEQQSRLWLSILVDFTHGAAIATAIGGRSYEDALAELLNGLAD